ncbi:GNAT family N-acetyltransferase [Streptomyces sp. NBC_00268]|uniref:GNAT family N-acetyltransferase n=1 Tax=Streptomyces sp. NBC_00268 TaxID=2975695 RepID=UPI00224CEEAA|nr:GNAT family N-acetyltransferase [Streptomyces sp. NBC_00268]MCX5182624.1 N-acetyltransferase [Streptomyces sp. NBC_00268]
MNGTTYRRTNDAESVRKLIVDIHVEVRGEFGLMDRPFYHPDRFNERLTTYASRPGWEAVVAYEGDEPIGYVFAVPLGENTGWWSSEKEPLPAEYTAEDGARTLALNEILVRRKWRGAHGKGAARALHEQLLGERQEQRVTLLVNPLLSDGRLKAVYESWGYKPVGSQQPFADSPVFASMMRDPLR